MCTKQHAQKEMQRIKNALDRRGIVYYEREDGMIRFPNTSGDCYIVPSQTYDGLLYVRYATTARCETATQALALCGVVTWNEVPQDYVLTEQLRHALKANGIKYTLGYVMGDKTTNEDNVTCVWFDGGPQHTVTFEEEDGCLHVEDGISVKQAVAIAMAG